MYCGGGHLGFPISLDGPLQTLRFLFRYEIQNGSYGRTWVNIGPYGKNVSKRFFSETTRIIDTKLPRQVVSEKKHFETFFQ
jgi:hypothetical protein